MLIEPIIGYKSTWRILSLLFETPRKPVSRSELFKFTKLGNSPLSRTLDRLCRAEILVLEKRGKKEFYYINERNEYVNLLQDLWKKETKSLRNLPYSVQIILSEFIRSLNDCCINVKKVILFGSYAKGTASINSDIDLALVFEQELDSELLITKIIKKLKKQFGKDIQVHSFTTKSFDSKNKLVQEIQNDGIELVK